MFHTAMKRLLLLLQSLLLLATALPAERPTYHGAQVFRVVPHLESQVTYLHGLMRQDRYDFWQEPRSVGSPVDIMATAFHLPELKAILEHLELEPSVMISNVGALVKAQEEERQLSPRRKMDWTRYNDYEKIDKWMRSLAKDYPTLCTVEELGKSFEGRSIKLLTIGTREPAKPAIFIEGGMHGREWISPATITYMVNKLVTNSDAYSDILSSVNLYVMPVVNPDGYDYTFEDDRLWIKTVSIIDPESGCMGVNPNMNWDIHWNEINPTSDPCSPIYPGPRPFSEVETHILRNQINRFASQIKVYLSIHSYSQAWFYPWGYSADPIEDEEDLVSLANDAVSALTSVYGTTYRIESPTDSLASGTSFDWVKDKAGIKYAYHVILRDEGNYGFLLPPEQIIPTGEETFEALRILAIFIKNN